MLLVKNAVDNHAVVKIKLVRSSTVRPVKIWPVKILVISILSIKISWSLSLFFLFFCFFYFYLFLFFGGWRGLAYNKMTPYTSFGAKSPSNPPFINSATIFFRRRRVSCGP